MIDACRLSRARVQVVPHNDVDAVDTALAGRAQPRAIVLVETIYSVLGDAAPVERLAEVCAARGAVLVADEAHALGVAGPGGRGLLHRAGLGGRPDVVATLTLSKSLGAQGGAVLSSPAVREHLVNRARPFIYDTGLAPAAAGGALAALRVVEAEPGRVDRVNEVAARARAGVPGRCTRGSGAGRPDAGAARGRRGGRESGRERRTHRMLPSPVHARRHLPAASHGTRAARRRGARAGSRGAGRPVVTVVAVTGTDTAVGKTVVTAALAAVQLARGLSVGVVKPAQTGVLPGDDGDLAEVRRLAGEVSVHEGVRLPDPLAPETAARVAGLPLPSLAEQQTLVGSVAREHDVDIRRGRRRAPRPARRRLHAGRRGRALPRTLGGRCPGRTRDAEPRRADCRRASCARPGGGRHRRRLVARAARTRGGAEPGRPAAGHRGPTARPGSEPGPRTCPRPSSAVSPPGGWRTSRLLPRACLPIHGLLRDDHDAPSLRCRRLARQPGMASLRRLARPRPGRRSRRPAIGDAP